MITQRQIRTPWLGNKHGTLSDWVTQRWVQFTGRSVNLTQSPWLDGPTGNTTVIGSQFFDTYAYQQGWVKTESQLIRGLVPRFANLKSPLFDPAGIQPEIVEFYEQTSQYELDLWSEWSMLFRPMGWLVATIFSRRLQQLNVPLSPLDAARGMTSEVFQFTDKAGNYVESAWVRNLNSSGSTLYAGSYSTCQIPNYPGPVMRVVFPLPNGHAAVFMAPNALADGSLVISSFGSSFGDPGFYFFVANHVGGGWAKHVPVLKESIHIYKASEELRADHRFVLWGYQFMQLHYRIRKKAV